MSDGEGERVLIPAMSPSVVPFLDELGGEFLARGFDVLFVPQNQNVGAFAKRESAFPERYCLEIVEHTPERDLVELTDKYGIASSRSVAFTQMIYDYENSDPPTSEPREMGTRYPPVTSHRGPDSYDPFVEWLHRCLDFLDQLYEDGNGGNPVQYQGSEILRRSLDSVATHHGYRSAWAGFSPIPGEVGYFTDESSRWPSFAEASYGDLTDEEIARASDYIAEVREDQPTIRGSTNDTDPTVLETIYGSAKRLVTDGRDSLPKSRFRIKRRTRRTVMAAYARRRYLSPDESATAIDSTDYVFYPLQYYVESRIPMRAPAFYEQSWFVEYMSRSVPTGHELVVKDHPQQLGAQPRRAVDVFASYAIALSPSLSAHDVIEGASVVVTLNNTVGYEALIHGKPVVALGDAFYDEYAVGVTDINDLDRSIKQALDSGGSSEEETIEFAHGLLAGSRAGVWRDTSAENVRNLVEGYITTLRSET